MSSFPRSVSCGRLAAEASRHVDQVVGDDPEADPAMHAVDAVIATASETMSPFDHADAPFAADAPALATPKPPVAFIRAPGRGFRPSSWEDDPAHAAIRGGLFVGGGAEAAIAGREMRRSAEGLVPIQGRSPQRDVGWSPGMDLVGGDDLMFRLLVVTKLPNSFGFEILPLRMFAVCGSKILRTLSGTCVSPPSRRARVCATTRCTNGRMCCSCAWARARIAAGRPRRRALTLAEAPDHGVRVSQHGACRRRQAPVALDQGIPCLRRPRLIPDCQHAASHAPQPIPHASGRNAQRGTRPLHRARQHPNPILQQGAVRGIVDVGFYDRRIDAKSTTARHPGPLRHVDHLPMQLRNDLWPQRARDLQNRFRIGHFVRIDA